MKYKRPELAKHYHKIFSEVQLDVLADVIKQVRTEISEGDRQTMAQINILRLDLDLPLVKFHKPTIRAAARRGRSW